MSPASFIPLLLSRVAIGLLVLTLGPRAYCQAPPAWQWARASTSANDVWPSKMITDPAGNVYVGGTFIEPLTLAPGTVFNSQGQQDAYVAKYSPSGALLWAQHLAGDGMDDVAGLALDTAGNLCLAGNCSSSMQLGSLSLSPPYGAALYLARLSAQGQPLWLSQATNTGVRAQNMGLDAADNFYVSGQISGTVGFGSLSLSTVNGIDIFLAKFDPQGEAVWARQGGRVALLPGGPAVMTVNHTLTVSPAGDCYLSCTLNSQFGSFGALQTPAGYGAYDVVLVKYDGQGTPRWLQRYGSGLADYAGNTALDANGHLLATMRFAGSFAGGPTAVGSQTLTGTGLYFASLLQLDAATGALGWARTISADRNCFFRSIAIDAAGNSYVAGSITGTATVGTQQLSSVGSINGDALVVSYSPQGSVRWAQQSGSYLDEGADLVSLDGTGQLAVMGFFRGEGRFGSTTLTSPATPNNSASGWVARLAGLPTATQPTAGPLALAFYPNPATDQLHLPTLAAGSRVQFLDALGRVARDTQVSAGALVSVRGLTPGFYTVRAITAKGQHLTGGLLVE
ncbi:T9SS type A sorting domain-containing protein [Hymenobacter sp. BT683]|uniref:T9SS type A sorting domain-containing protein n=1 Tax=Hymenobacter jeongseonensis TaxID=2791027 RepID=A0ABS0ICF1_9BACT|nr:T9SS type A sorting domain-containing protein [Hymenobacter jeongseonensis]MBF9236028.1 T9SS type A sorting domain-containing protein [Hymenobacter jeongseonensis]